MKIQGTTSGTRFLHAARQMRGAYLQNVREGRCELDRQILKDFDNMIEDANGRYRTKNLPAKR